MRLRKDLERAKLEQRQIRAQERQKSEYVERECQLYKERFEAVKQEALQFEAIAHQVFLNYSAMSERLQEYQRDYASSS